MQNKIISLLAAFSLLVTGCMDLGSPYAGDVHVVSIQAVYPQGFSPQAGAEVVIEGINNEIVYELSTNAEGRASARMTNGLYSISVQDRSGNHLFNGSLDKVLVNGEDLSLQIDLFHSIAGSLVIKELYCGGCPKLPEEGTYQSDQYLIVHNNDRYTTYLDGLCLGTLSPYNSTASNPWIGADGSLPDFAPVIQAIWRIGGTGTSFPLEPGADAVICLRGAINHAAQYPLSVNLNRPGYFVCYNPVYFPNPAYHPAPGDQIAPDHYLEVVILYFLHQFPHPDSLPHGKRHGHLRFRGPAAESGAGSRQFHRPGSGHPAGLDYRRYGGLQRRLLGQPQTPAYEGGCRLRTAFGNLQGAHPYAPGRPAVQPAGRL